MNQVKYSDVITLSTVMKSVAWVNNRVSCVVCCFIDVQLVFYWQFDKSLWRSKSFANCTKK